MRRARRSWRRWVGRRWWPCGLRLLRRRRPPDGIDEGDDRRRDGARLVAHAAMREAHDAVAERGEFGVADAVTLEGGERGVMLAAVGLDDQVAGAPEEVDLVAGDEGVDLRPLDAVVVADVAHERLELGARDRRLVMDVGDDLCERGGAAGVAVGGE